MKLLVSVFVIALITSGVYVSSSKIFKIGKNKSKTKPLLLTAVTVVILFGLLACLLYKSTKAPDTWCEKTHEVTSNPPSNLRSAMDYFDQGNYDYDAGNCEQAVTDYTTSINLDPTYPQAYNNRAYTYMRMRNYPAALPDLDKALNLKPDYIQALMNRGDIHNYYYATDRPSAIQDYQKAISLGASQKGTSVCGHLFLAEHNGWNLGTLIALPISLMSCN